MESSDTARRGFASLRAKWRRKCATEQRHILLSLAKRWDANGEDVQAIEEVLTEPPRGDGLGKVAIRGGDHPNVDVDRLSPTHPFELLLLQHAKQGNLRIRCQLTDLVEEQGALRRPARSARSAVPARP